MAVSGRFMRMSARGWRWRYEVHTRAIGGQVRLKVARSVDPCGQDC